MWGLLKELLLAKSLTAPLLRSHSGAVLVDDDDDDDDDDVDDDPNPNPNQCTSMWSYMCTLILIALKNKRRGSAFTSQNIRGIPIAVL